MVTANTGVIMNNLKDDGKEDFYCTPTYTQKVLESWRMAMDHYIVNWALTHFQQVPVCGLFSRLVNTQHWEHTWAVEASFRLLENIYLPFCPSVCLNTCGLIPDMKSLFFLKHLRVVLQVESPRN